MKAVIYTGPNQVEVVDKPIPEPGPGDVVVKVTASGLCGSDLHVYRGHNPGPPETGFTMGHELVGTIHSIGSSITRFKIGDRVVSPFTVSCGTCFFCERGLTGRCEQSLLLGCKKLEGVQAEYARIPLAESTIHLAPPGIPDAHLIMMADILPTGCFVAKNGWEMLREAERVGAVCVVIGCGPVGLCAIMAAKERFSKVFCVDPEPSRLALAATYGATPLDPSSRSSLLSATSSRGADVVLEVVGNPSALALAMDLVRTNGVVSSCGVHHEDLGISGDDAYSKGLRMQFGRCHARAMFDEALILLTKISRESPKLIDEFVQKKVKLEEAPEYYRLFNERKVGKVIFDLTL